MMAAEAGHLAVVNTLLAAGAAVEIQIVDNAGQSTRLLSVEKLECSKLISGMELT